MPNVQLRLTALDGTEAVYSSGLSFSLVKERYTPYTMLTASFLDSGSPSDIKRIRLYINGIIRHSGIVDTVDYSKQNGLSRVTVASKGFTSLLNRNQMTPGVITSVSLDKLIGDYYTLPEVTAENDSTEAGYIFCKDGSTMWDAIANLSQKLYNLYPYIRGCNIVTISPPTSPSSFTVNPQSVTAFGTKSDYTKMASHFHMQDISNSYGVYNAENTAATARNIVCHKEIALDRQHLDNPVLSLAHKINYCMRGYKSVYVEYEGFLGEDLCDTISYGSHIASKSISKLEVRYSGGRLLTKISAYLDNYCNT